MLFDVLKIVFKLGEGSVDVVNLLVNQDIFGNFVGCGWEWVVVGYLVGGFWLWQCKIISWYVLFVFIGVFILIFGVFWLYNLVQFVSLFFYFFFGGVMIGVFFIVIDLVIGCMMLCGKLIFVVGVGFFIYIICVFGGYFDGVVFVILLMNLCVLVIDLLIQLFIFGMKEKL